MCDKLTESFVKVCPSVQCYAWGVKGLESKVAQLWKNDLKVKANEPYAELWIGYHPRGENRIANTNESIESFIKRNLDFFSTANSTSNDLTKVLPFLLKVLSIATPLSIQSHPDKLTAQQLHKSNPTVYCDGNHKPEIAIALTPFEAICGFRPWREIAYALSQVLPLKTLLGIDFFTAHANTFDNPQPDNAAISAAIKHSFQLLFGVPQTQIQNLLKEVEECQSPKDAPKGSFDATLKEQLCLFRKLKSYYSMDVGCLAAFFLNYIELIPGEAIFMGPNTLHAYVKGDCVECLANSDNVIRAGLTPKPIDLNLLCETVNFLPSDPVRIVPKAVQLGDKENSAKDKDMQTIVMEYIPPATEFKVFFIEFKGKDDKSVGEDVEILFSRTSCTALLALEGSFEIKEKNEIASTHSLGEGSCGFLRCCTPVKILAKCARGGSRCLMVAATSNE